MLTKSLIDLLIYKNWRKTGFGLFDLIVKKQGLLLTSNKFNKLIPKIIVKTMLQKF